MCPLPPRDVSFSPKRCALLNQEVCTSFLGAYDAPSTALRNHPPPCCATQHRLLRNKIGTPPNLRISKSPRYENISRLSDHALSSAKITHNTIIPTNQKIHSRHDCGPSHESSGPEGILKPLSNSSLNFSHLVIITFYHKI